jgi:hypothetical protein
MRFSIAAYSSSFHLHAIGLIFMVVGAVGFVVWAWDLALGDSPVRLELKPFGYLQEWLQKRYMSPNRPTRKAHASSKQSCDPEGQTGHRSNLYVFALPSHRDARTPDPLDVGQWRFFLVPTWKIDRLDRTALSMPMLTSMAKEVGYTELPDAVRHAADRENGGQNR